MDGLTKVEKLAFYFACTLVAGSSIFVMSLVLTQTGVEFKDGIGMLLNAGASYGAIAAVLVAVRNHKELTETRQREAIDTAYLAAAGIANQLDIFLTKLRHLPTEMEFNAVDATGSDIPHTQTDRLRWLERVQALCSDDAPRLDPDLLKALIPLPHHCATRLQSALAGVEWIKKHANYGTEGSAIIGSERRCAARVNVIKHKLYWCIDMLSGPVAVINRAHNDGAPYPSVEEIYGDE